MTTEPPRAPSAPQPSVCELHRRWLRILDRLTGAPIGHGPQIAGTRSRGTAEVILKQQTAARPLLISGAGSRLVDSAARDLREPGAGSG